MLNNKATKKDKFRMREFRNLKPLMKTWLIIVTLLCISFIINAQDCNKVYRFTIGDRTSYSISCGTIEGDAWRVSKNSCNFYTPLTSTSDEGTDRWIDISGSFSGSDNLDSRDFVWIFYYVNGNVVKTSTIKAEMDQTNYNFKDSLLIPSGGSYRFRIAMVCDEADEFWMLGDQNLTICTRVEQNEPVIAQILPTEKISVIKERNIVKLNWFAEPESSGNYFKIERSKNGESFEFAGFVKENYSTGELTRYSFIDAGAVSPQMWYRIFKVNVNGEEKSIGEMVSIQL